MPEKENLSLWQSVLRGIAGALVFHLSCNLLFWLLSFGPSFADVLMFALAQIAGPVILGAFVGFLCFRCHINQSFGVAFITMSLALLTAFIASEYIGVQMGTSHVSRNMMVLSITIIIAGIVVALLIVGLITIVSRFRGRQT